MNVENVASGGGGAAAASRGQGLASDDAILACIKIVAGLYNRSTSVMALRAGLPIGDEGVSPEVAVRAAEKAGLTAKLSKRKDLSKILQVMLPCVVLLRNGEACVLTKFIGKESAEIIYPDGGTNQVNLVDLAADYLGYVIFLRERFAFDARAAEVRLKEPKSWFWGTLAKFWGIYNHVLLASILINCFALALPLFIMNVYDRVVPNNAVESLWVLGSGVLVVLLFEFILKNVRSYFVDVAGKNADTLIASRLFNHYLHIKLSAKSGSTGGTANAMREFEALREFFSSGTIVALVDLPFIFLFIGVIYFVAGPLAFVPLVVVPVVILTGVFLQMPMRGLMEKTFREATQKHAMLIEGVEGLESVKAIQAEGHLQRRWEDCVAATADTSRKTRLLANAAISLAQSAIHLSTVAVVIFGVYLIAEGDLTVGALVAATILTGRALAPLSQVASLITRFQQSRVALKALDNIMHLPSERPADRQFLHRDTFEGKIEFSSVEFSYPGQQIAAVRNASFTIQPGEKVGIIGRIGSGKTTVDRLISGLYEPDGGAVLIDDTDVRQLDPAELRHAIGYVGQDNFLFFGSVRDNIRLGAPWVDDEAMVRAAQLAGVHDFVKAHPQGYDMQVGERGMALSGGQRQAVVLARALLTDPPILIFDEPTSQLDNQTERQFIRNLNEIVTGKTLIISTHRSSILELVDRLIVLDQGKVVADGAKETVVAALKEGKLRTA
jgi:ATP-binding cassette subfamily C protein LapB